MTTVARVPRPGRAIRVIQAIEGRLDGNPHQPHQPEWTCQACGNPWPCSPARTRLAESYGRDRIGLSIYLTALLFAAVAEMPTTPVPELFERFVSWTRYSPPAMTDRTAEPS